MSDDTKLFFEKGIKYDISDMEKCEYVEARAKTFSKRPKQENGKCEGFRNKYSKDISFVCSNCGYWKGE